VTDKQDDKGTETMDTLLSIPIWPKYNEPLKVVAKRNGRTVAGHIRWLITQELKSEGLLDENLEPVAGGQ
jgi:hypothetical protein